MSSSEDTKVPRRASALQAGLAGGGNAVTLVRVHIAADVYRPHGREGECSINFAYWVLLTFF